MNKSNSPYRDNIPLKMRLKLSIFLSLILTVPFVLITPSFLEQNLTTKVLIMISCFIVLVLMSLFCFYITDGKTIFHTEVKHFVEPSDLIVGQTYYLNGQNKAKYIGQESYTGKYQFLIEGVHSQNEIDTMNRENAEQLYPGQVRKYISANKEI